MTTYNLILNRGSVFNANLNIKNPDLTPIDLTDYFVRGAIKTNFTDNTALLNLTPTIILPESGIINLRIEASGIAVLPINQLRYDIELYSGDYALKLLNGLVDVNPEITT